jgi:hypothetical protein
MTTDFRRYLAERRRFPGTKESQEGYGNRHGALFIVADHRIGGTRRNHAENAESRRAVIPERNIAARRERGDSAGDWRV